MQLMNFKAWIEGLPGNPLVTQAAEKAGIDRSTISRQLKRGDLPADVVIKLCRAHGYNPIDGLVETGHLYAHEVPASSVPRSQILATTPNGEILAEINRRSDPESIRLFDAADDSSVITTSFGQHDDDDALPADLSQLAANYGEKGVPDIISEAEESQVNDDDDDFDHP